MEFSQIFTLGLLAGVTVGAPWGPSGTYCLYQSLQSGWVTGVFTALGSVVAIFIFSFLAGIFIETLAPLIQDQQIASLIRLVMGFLLLFIGLLIFYSNRKRNAKKKAIVKMGNLESFVSAFGLGLISGKNVIGFPTFLVASQQILEGSALDITDAFLFGAGSLISSAALYILLVIITVKFGRIVFSRILPFMNYILALLFVSFGLYLILNFLS